MVERIGIGSVTIGLYQMNYLVAAGYALALVAAVAAAAELVSAGRSVTVVADDEPGSRAASVGKGKEPLATYTGLRDLAALAFVASLTFMALEMVAGRMVTRHLGSSIYGWSSVIAVLLAGLSLGNFLGGKIADFIHDERRASWLFLVASLLTLSVIFLETPPRFFATNVLGDLEPKSLLSHAPEITKVTIPGGKTVPVTWPFRILIVTIAMFFLPALSMGTVSPVVAKLAVNRLRALHRTGTAIGQVYAWGMVGSILGTFLTGFVLIDYLGTKGVVLVLATILALGATFLGDLFHAVWAGIPLGLCAIAFVPPPWAGVFSRVVPGINPKTFAEMGQHWGVREPVGDPSTSEDALRVGQRERLLLHQDRERARGGRRPAPDARPRQPDPRLLHPEPSRAARLRLRAHLRPGRLPRRHGRRPGDVQTGRRRVAGRGRSATKARRARRAGRREGEPARKGAGRAEARPRRTIEGHRARRRRQGGLAEERGRLPERVAHTAGRSAAGRCVQEGRRGAEPEAGRAGIDAGPGAPPAGKKKIEATIEVPESTRKDLRQVFDDERKPGPYLPPVESSSLKTLFLGGGAYCFQRHMQFAYPGTSVNVAEIDPAVTRANMAATGLPNDTPIVTYWGDARQFVELHQDTKKYDLIFGDAFNDFSVPWHLTTREFNEKLKKMLTPDGVYMINIIDVYLSDAEAENKAEEEIKDKEITDDAEKKRIHEKWAEPGQELRRIRRLVDQDGDADLRQGQRVHLRHRRPRRRPARDVRGGGLDEAAGPEGPGEAEGRSPVLHPPRPPDHAQAVRRGRLQHGREQPIAGHRPDRRLRAGRKPPGPRGRDSGRSRLSRSAVRTTH